MAKSWDLYLCESGSGGDFTMNGNDLAIDESVANDIYLRMFGGNIESDTKSPRQTNEQVFDYWGNTFINDPLLQFNSLTERTLNKTPLNSFGRTIIETAIKKDLQSFQSIESINVAIVSTDRINVSLGIRDRGIRTFALVINPATGDFDMRDFDPRDFF
jgi:hypothetical protein